MHSSLVFFFQLPASSSIQTPGILVALFCSNVCESIFNFVVIRNSVVVDFVVDLDVVVVAFLGFDVVTFFVIVVVVLLMMVVNVRILMLNLIKALLLRCLRPSLV